MEWLYHLCAVLPLRKELLQQTLIFHLLRCAGTRLAKYKKALLTTFIFRLNAGIIRLSITGSRK